MSALFTPEATDDAVNVLEWVEVEAFGHLLGVVPFEGLLDLAEGELLDKV